MIIKGLILFASALILVAMPTDVEAAEAAPASTAARQSPDPDQKIRCRKVEVSGSLIKKGKVCRTIAEWREIMSNGNRTARAIVESGQICAGQCGGN